MSGFGGSSGGTAMVRMVLDTGGFQSKLSAAQSQTVAATSKMGTSFTKLGGIAKQVLGTLGAVEVIRRSVAAYDEQVKAVARLNVAFGNSPALIGASTAAFVEQASALSKLTGVQDEQIISAMAALSVFNLTADQLARIAPLVLDYAAFTGTDVTSAAESMGRAVLGNARALKTIGIDFKRTGDSAADFESIMAQVGDKVGGSAEAMATPMDKLRVAADEAFESIGKSLAPTLEGLATVLGILPPALTAAIVGLVAFRLASEKVQAGLVKWLPWVIGVSQGLALLGDTMKEDTSFAEALTKRLQDVLGMVGIEAEGINFMDDLGITTAELTAAFPFLADNIANAQAKLAGFSSAAEAAAQATRDLRSAQLELAGGMLGLVTSANSANAAESALGAARRELNRLTKAGAQGTAEWREAQVALNGAQIGSVQATISLNAAILDYQNKLANGEVSRAQAISDLRAMGGAAGLTKGEVNGLIARVLAIPKRATTLIDVKTAEALATVAAFNAAMAAIPNRTIYINAVAVGSGVQYVKMGAAEGAIVKGGQGLITNGPMMLRPNVQVGEGGYSTPWGRGAEAVTPLNASGRKILAEAFAMALRENGVGGGGGTVKVYGPGDPDLIADAVVRKMARMR